LRKRSEVPSSAHQLANSKQKRERPFVEYSIEQLHPLIHNEELFFGILIPILSGVIKNHFNPDGLMK